MILPRLRYLLLSVAAVAVALPLAIWVWNRQAAERDPQSTVGSTQVRGGLPVVMPTSGGRLEVSTVTVYERFSRQDVKQIFGMAVPLLGTNETHLQLRVVYRYHLDMARQWPIDRLPDGRWVVRAGPVKPTLPVAFDTRDLEYYSRSGWARFDGNRSTVDLLRGITPELEKRGQSNAYRQLATDAGRKTVAEFVRTWLLANRHASDAAKAKVVVLFPGEAVDQPP